MKNLPFKKTRIAIVILLLLELALGDGLYKTYTRYQQGNCADYIAFVNNFTDLKQVRQFAPQVHLTQTITARMLGKNYLKLNRDEYALGVGTSYEWCQNSGKNLYIGFYQTKLGSITFTANELARLEKLNANIKEVGRFIFINMVFGVESKQK